MPRRNQKPVEQGRSKRDRARQSRGLEKKIDPDFDPGKARGRNERRACDACGGAHAPGDFCKVLGRKVW